MQKSPAIIVIAYDRPKPLIRLLQSIANAIYEIGNIDLIISIDKSECVEVQQIANDFEWSNGNKKIIAYQSHLGLKPHVLACGDLTEQYGSAIFLEDDLIVAPYYYNYALQVLNFYKSENAVAGFSLYNYQVAESSFKTFNAIEEGNDSYFLQVASSWGQIWTEAQWKYFRTWLMENPELPNDHTIPDYLKVWGIHSWKKHFIHYLIDTNRYFVFPRVSHSTNFEEPGTHAATKNVFHVPMQLSKREYLFSCLNDSKSVYDAWFEIKPDCLKRWNNQLSGYDFAVDFYNVKKFENLNCDYILTTRNGTDPVLSFGDELFPYENNVALNLQGNQLNLFRKHAVLEMRESRLRNFLEAANDSNDLLISIIIPVVSWNIDDFKKTVRSVLDQNYFQKEVIVVCAADKISQVENIVSYHKIRIKTIASESNLVANSLQIATHQLNHGIACWLNPGSILSSDDVFIKVNSIFKNYGTVDWIRGINIAGVSPETDEHLRTLKYRMTREVAFEKLKHHTAELNTEMDFFRTFCFDKIKTEWKTIEELFLEMIAIFNVNIVVDRFGETLQANSKSITKEERMNLLKRFQHFEIKKGMKRQLAEQVLKLPFISTQDADWLYPTIYNYPLVLRYDSDNKSYFFNKF